MATDSYVVTKDYTVPAVPTVKKVATSKDDDDVHSFVEVLHEDTVAAIAAGVAG